jgi:uncharacterized membrane protein
MRLSKKKKLRTAIYSVLILAASLMPYIHDLFPKGVDFPGYSSSRVFLYIVLINVFGLIGWLLFFIHAKGRSYRFIIILPVLTTTYQICLHILNLKETSFNELNLKFILTFFIFVFLVGWYYIAKLKLKD